jgi:hypothetical protein
VVLVVAIFYHLFTKIDLGQVWTEITSMTWLELTTLGLLAVWNLCTDAFVWMTVTPALSFGRAMVMTQSTTAVANTVPGGSAIGIAMTYSMLGTWGYSRSRSTTAVLVSGVWNSFIKLAMPNCALRERLTWPRRSGATWGNGGPHGGSRWFHGKDGSPPRFRRGLHKADDQRLRWSSSHPGWLRPVGK